MKDKLTPRQIVEKLDNYIVGQDKAKKSVAIALRNRYRRKEIKGEMQEEVVPKNILMIGPTGVGKTEIARRLARIAESPFIKIEVSKFTEVGYVGRDVESIVRDLVETAIRMIKSEKMKDVEDKAYQLAEKRIVEKILQIPNKKKKNPFDFLINEEKEDNNENYDRINKRRKKLMER